MLQPRLGCQTSSSLRVLMFHIWGSVSLASSIATMDVDPKPWGLYIKRHAYIYSHPSWCLIWWGWKSILWVESSNFLSLWRSGFIELELNTIDPSIWSMWWKTLILVWYYYKTDRDIIRDWTPIASQIVFWFGEGACAESWTVYSSLKLLMVGLINTSCVILQSCR